MAETTRFVIGAEVSCSDGACGQVRRVVVDPVAEAVTHLVAGPEHPHGLGRLVPVDLIGAVAGQIRLRCTLAEFARLDWAKQARFLPKSGVYSGYAPGQVFSWPYYGVGARLAPFHTGIPSRPSPITPFPWERWRSAAANLSTPPTATSAGSRASSSARATHRVTHVLLQEGHLRGRKEVAIPVSAVASTGDGIQLTVTKQEVQDLPPVDIDDPGGSTGGEDTDDQSGH